MSNSLAIAAVTATLRNVLLRAASNLPSGNVTTKPIDKARAGTEGKDQLNLFLYHTVLNAAWRNMDMPLQVRSGETGQPPLALNLHYLVTAFGQGDDDTLSHRWLGMAMTALHDHPVLGAQEIQDALAENSELQHQVERVRITPQPMSVDELSRLWTAFQTQYRISAAYQVEVVIMESRRPARLPLPVLGRGDNDSGFNAQGNLIPSFPTIEDVQFIDPRSPNLQPMQPRVSVEPGDKVAILGHHFAAANGDANAVTVIVRLTALFSKKTNDLTVLAGDHTDQRINVEIPNESAGLFKLVVLVMPNDKPEEARETNEWPLMVAPVILDALPMTLARANVVNGLGDATINLSCRPEVKLGQRVSLALGGLEVPAVPPANPLAAPANPLSFLAKQVGAGAVQLRLRVDGVDSHFLDLSDPAKPKMDPTKKVIFT